MPVGSPRSFYKKFKFTVEIDGFTYFGFQKCSELKAEVGVVEHREGGVLLADKTPGLVTVPNITLERGATKDQEMFNWFKQVVDMAANLGEGRPDPGYARNMDIVQHDRDGSVLMRFPITNAWPRTFVAGEWDNDADEVVITSMELVIEKFDQKITTI
jgi:phage tail-like protein